MNFIKISSDAKLFLSRDKQWNILCFSSSEEAQKSLDFVKETLLHQCPELSLVNVTNYSQSTTTPFRFRLSPKQWELLRKEVRACAHKNEPSGDFFIKSLRVDEYNYYRRFIKMITPPFEQYPLRLEEKKRFTVTGQGIFQRREFFPDFEGF